MRGQDAAAWLCQAVLPSILEPGEQIGPIGLAYVRNFPLGMDRWMFDGMVIGQGRRPLERGVDQQAIVVLTSHRVLVLPSSITGKGAAIDVDLAGVVTIRWAAVREIKTDKNIQKYWLSLGVKNPNQPNENMVFRIYFWSKEDSLSSHADFVARSWGFAQERAGAARAAQQPEPALFFEAPMTSQLPPLAPGYAPPPVGGYFPPPMGYAGAARTSGMAIAGFVLSFFCGLLGVIFSAIALGQINKSNGQLKGKGLAIAGLVISIVAILINLAFLSLRRRHHF